MENFTNKLIVGIYLIIRKLFSGLIAGILLMLIYFLLEQSGFVLLIGVYLLPILLIYGVLSSILSDFVTKRLRGLLRGSLALFIHLFFAASFVLMPILEMERRFNRLVLITALLSSSLFWCIDEFLRSKRAKDICEKIDELEIY
ncbi:hypothetical protein MKY15_11950 [Sporosarcina sp. FSL K6-1540]|uniref:hypothetical protein n=1 Tax=unclassified Sporosarcina TaxID=2647733 RepID=UPI00164E4E78|nr:hypothetical protein [Sporosarcina sp. resist]QNK88963.1 hypothetical protein H7992_04345 [Sporosarcina sp. resist]